MVKYYDYTKRGIYKNVILTISVHFLGKKKSFSCYKYYIFIMFQKGKKHGTESESESSFIVTSHYK